MCRSVFTGNAGFRGAVFIGAARFGRARFAGKTDFDGTTWQAGTFRGVDFGMQAVTFHHPKIWNPGPSFDWSDDPARQPANVEPSTWPPAPISR